MLRKGGGARTAQVAWLTYFKVVSRHSFAGTPRIASVPAEITTGYFANTLRAQFNWAKKPFHTKKMFTSPLIKLLYTKLKKQTTNKDNNK
jgi:hypothetical protein